MAYFYVMTDGVNDGTATGDGGRYASQQTGAMTALTASGYYASINAAMGANNPPAAGDYVCCADSHALSSASAITVTGSSSGEFVYIVSVDKDNIEQAKSGASETSTSGSNNLNFDLQVACYGMTFTTNDDFYLSSHNSQLILNGCTMTCAGGGDRMRLTVDGVSVIAYDTTFNFDVQTGYFWITAGASFAMYGGTIASADTQIDALVDNAATGGGAFFKLVGVDIEAVNAGYIVGTVGDSADDILNIELDACKMHSSTNFCEQAFTYPNHKLTATRCGSSSATAEHQFFIRRGLQGDAEDQDDSGIHRDESTAFDGGTKVSIKATTGTQASKLTPFIFDLPARWAALSDTATDTVRIYFASTTALTDVDVWAELFYPDGTNKHMWNRVSNANSETGKTVVDPFATGNPHTDDSGSSTWKDGASDATGYNEYRMDVSTSTDAGADSVPLIRIYCGIASTTIYFDTEVDLV